MSVVYVQIGSKLKCGSKSPKSISIEKLQPMLRSVDRDLIMDYKPHLDDPEKFNQHYIIVNEISTSEDKKIIEAENDRLLYLSQHDETNLKTFSIEEAPG
jgi:hypothetical protein